MTVSASVRSSRDGTHADLQSTRPGFWRQARPALIVALVYLAAHLPSLAPSLEDIDSINFALALHDYDPTANRPHPPGYPVYIALGKASLAAVQVVAPAADSTRTDALALAILSALGGAIALMAAWAIFSALVPGHPSVALLAAGLLAAAPLFWMTGLRPMSDMPGLAAVLVAQALLLRGFADPRSLTAGAFTSGLAIGLRSQAVWLTLPLLAVTLVANRRQGLHWLATRPCAALVGAGLLWAAPLLMAAGGLARYLQALGGQAGDDFAFVDMLWNDPTPRHLARALRETFVFPWASNSLANGVLLLALAGAALAALRERGAVGKLAIAFGPYTVFHLAFQDTPFVRYALPVLPAVAFLAARAIAAAGRLTPVLGASAVAAALIVAVPGGLAYGREAHPAFRAIHDMLEAAPREHPGKVFAHHALGRPLAVEAAAPLPSVDPPNRYEWLGPVDYWRGGGLAPIWFLGDPRRTDLALIDPQSRRQVTTYRWRVGERRELGGTRPLGADWYRIESPGWFAGEGWSLTLEAGGVTAASGKGLDRRPIEAYVRRRSEPTWMMVGGRDLGSPASGPSVLELTIDGRPVETWRHDPASGANFLRTIALPSGIPPGPGAYARLVIAARAEAGGTATPPVAIRQFDVQSNALIYGFGAGWHEEEADPLSRLRWRWTSDRSVLQVLPPQSVEVTLRGESPLKYFDAPPTVRLLAGGRVIDTLQPSQDFEWRVIVPLEDAKRSNGAITLETDRVYLPAQAEGTGDARRLGIRLFDVHVDPVQP